MYKAQKIALGLLAAAAVATASDVIQLKKDTFDDFIKSNDLVLAECKSSFAFIEADFEPVSKLTGVVRNSLCPVVWPLQGSRARV